MKVKMKSMTKAILAAIAAASILSACGSSSSSSSSSSSEVANLLNRTAGSGNTAIGRLPQGRATYDGVGVFTPADQVADRLRGLDGSTSAAVNALEGIADDAILTADATLTADFDAGQLSGELTDFVGRAGEEFSGSVDVIAPNGAAPNIVNDNGAADVDIQLTGTITADGGPSTFINGDGTGSFGGETGEFVLISTGTTAIGGINEDLGGFIVGERD